MDRDYVSEVNDIINDNIRAVDKVKKLKSLLDECENTKDVIVKALREVQSAEEPFRYMVGRYYRDGDVYCKVIDLDYSYSFYCSCKDYGVCITICTNEEEISISQDENKCGHKPLKDECEISEEEFIKALEKATMALSIKTGLNLKVTEAK